MRFDMQQRNKTALEIAEMVHERVAVNRPFLAGVCSHPVDGWRVHIVTHPEGIDCRDLVGRIAAELRAEGIVLRQSI
jgi:hypothetical protein